MHREYNRSRQLDAEPTCYRKVTVQLKNGRTLSQSLEYFPGMPQRPLSTDELWQKFNRLTSAVPDGRARALFDRLLALESVGDVAQLEMI